MLKIVNLQKFPYLDKNLKHDKFKIFNFCLLFHTYMNLFGQFSDFPVVFKVISFLW